MKKGRKNFEFEQEQKKKKKKIFCKITDWLIFSLFWSLLQQLSDFLASWWFNAAGISFSPVIPRLFWTYQIPSTCPVLFTIASAHLKIITDYQFVLPLTCAITRITFCISHRYIDMIFSNVFTRHVHVKNTTDANNGLMATFTKQKGENDIPFIVVYSYCCKFVECHDNEWLKLRKFWFLIGPYPSWFTTILFARRSLWHAHLIDLSNGYTSEKVIHKRLRRVYLATTRSCTLTWAVTYTQSVVLRKS